MSELKEARERFGKVLETTYNSFRQGICRGRGHSCLEEVYSLLLEFPVLARETFDCHHKKPALPLFHLVSLGADLMFIKAVHEMHPHLCTSKDEAESWAPLFDRSRPSGTPAFDVFMYLMEAHPELKTILPPAQVKCILHRKRLQFLLSNLPSDFDSEALNEQRKKSLDEAFSILSKFQFLADATIKIKWETHYGTGTRDVYPISLFVSHGANLECIQALSTMFCTWYATEDVGDKLAFTVRGVPRTDVLVHLIQGGILNLLDSYHAGKVLESLMANTHYKASDHANLEILVNRILDKKSVDVHRDALQCAHCMEGFSEATLDKMAEHFVEISVNGQWTSSSVLVSEDYRRVLKRVLPKLKALLYWGKLKFATTEDFTEFMELFMAHGKHLQKLELMLPCFLLAKSSIARQSLASMLQQTQINDIKLNFDRFGDDDDDDDGESGDSDMDDNVIIQAIGEAMWQRDTPIARLTLSGFYYLEESPANKESLGSIIMAPNAAIDLCLDGNCIIEGTHHFGLTSKEGPRPSIKVFRLSTKSEVYGTFLDSIFRFFSKLPVLNSLHLPNFSAASEMGANIILDLLRHNMQLKTVHLYDFREASLGQLWDILKTDHSLEQLKFSLARLRSARVEEEEEEDDDDDDDDGEEEEEDDDDDGDDGDGKEEEEEEEEEEMLPEGWQQSTDAKTGKPFYLDPQGKITWNRPTWEEGLCELLETSNTTLKCCSFPTYTDYDGQFYGSDIKNARRWSFCKQVGYYLELNSHGRKAAREATNKRAFVNLLASSRVMDKNWRFSKEESGLKDHPKYSSRFDAIYSRHDPREAEAYKTSFLYGLLREQPVYWSANQNDDVLPSAAKRRKTSSYL